MNTIVPELLSYYKVRIEYEKTDDLKLDALPDKTETIAQAVFYADEKGSRYEGDTVVDLFGGSGSTGIASDNTKRNGICFELNNDISTASKERGEKRKEKDLHAETLFGNGQ